MRSKPITATDLRRLADAHYDQSEYFRSAGTNDDAAREHYVAGKLYAEAAQRLGTNNADAALLSARAARIARTLEA